MDEAMNLCGAAVDLLFTPLLSTKLKIHKLVLRELITLLQDEENSQQEDEEKEDFNR